MRLTGVEARNNKERQGPSTDKASPRVDWLGDNLATAGDTLLDPMALAARAAVQPKLAATTPGDSHERQADRAADSAMRTLDAAGGEAASSPAVGSLLSATAPLRNIARAAAPGGGASAGGAMAGPAASDIRSAASGGQPLAAPVRSRMEGALGGDFGNVRVHTGGKADSLGADLGARAFTQGSDVFFRGGEYAPGTRGGDHLLAHELSHTMQQGAANRVAGWWADGHGQLTRQSGMELAKGNDRTFHPKTIDWLSRHAGAQDLTMRSTVNFAIYCVVAKTSDKKKDVFIDRLKGVKKMGEGGLRTKEENELKEKWEKLDFHMRMSEEMPLHGEAGGYRTKGGGPSNNMGVKKQLNKAISQYNKGAYREGLLQLADALHSAEDRGAHGEGNPWTGHDPRLLIPYRWDGAPNKQYTPGWDPDNPGKNSGGRKIGLKWATKAYGDFYAGLTNDAKKNLKDGLGGTGQKKSDSSKWKLKIGSAKTGVGHGFRWLVGPTLQKGGEKKVQDPQARVGRKGDYDKSKRFDGDETSNAMPNMDTYLAGGGIAKDIIAHTSAVYSTALYGKMPTDKQMFRLSDDAAALGSWAMKKSSALRGVQDAAPISRALLDLAWMAKTVGKKADAWEKTRVQLESLPSGLKRKRRKRMKEARKVWFREMWKYLSPKRDEFKELYDKIWPNDTFAIPEPNIQTEDDEIGGEEDVIAEPSALEKAKGDVEETANFIYNQLSAEKEGRKGYSINGPAYLEKKMSAYSILERRALAWKKAAGEAGDNAAVKKADRMAKNAALWKKKALTSGMTTTKGARKFLRSTIMYNLEWFLDKV